MALLLKDMIEGVSDKVAEQVVDTFLRESEILQMLPFDNTVSPQGGSTLTYSYLQTQIPSTAAFRKLNEEYKDSEAKLVKKSADLKIFGGKFNMDRVLKYEMLQILIRETGADALLMNASMISKVQTMARILGYKTETEEAFGKKVTSMDGVRFMDLKDHYTVESGTTVTANACVKNNISRTVSGSSATTGLTDIYAVKFDVNDGFHAATITGSSAISQYLPDFNQPGAVKDGEVEMVAATVLKNTKHAGVIRNIKIV